MKIYLNNEQSRQEIAQVMGTDLTGVNVVRYQSEHGYGIVAILNYYTNMDVELYVMGKGSWLNKQLLRHIFTYVFTMLNCKRCTARIESKNKKSINLVERLGFVREGELRGIDTYLYSLLREDCKWVAH